MTVSSDQPSIFKSMVSSAATDLMSQQLSTNQPQPVAGLVTTSNPLVPDRLVRERLSHMDPDIFDLSDSSHLMKLIKVLLGSAGGGGLRKQMSVMRLSNAFSGMHFLDLDRFYGSLFGIHRLQSELAPNFAFDPYTDATDGDSWDDLRSRDASYRDRLVKFAKAVYHGGSYTGLRSMVSALIAADCNLYESWEWIDEQAAGIGVNSAQIYTYTNLAANETWSGMGSKSWGEWGGGATLFLGRTGQKNRAEVIIQPQRSLAPDEIHEIMRVVNKFKPAGTQFTINASGLAVQNGIQIRAVAADSEYWDVKATVIPNTALPFNPYPAQTSPAVRPAFSQYQGESWVYNADMSVVSSYTLSGETATSSSDDGLVVYTDGTSRTYVAPNAVMAPARAASARLVSDGVLTVSPYAPARAVIG